MRNDNPSPDRGMGTGVLAGLGAVALIAAVVIWSPWNGSHVAPVGADRSGPLARGFVRCTDSWVSVGHGFVFDNSYCHLG
jgi:hypothetical protein